MGLNAQTSGERVHIGFFGLRNAGKSSVVNAVTGQSLSVVSDVKGTTTDPVKKAMELLPLGPVVIIDTPGIDDEGTLGAERVRRALRVLDETDAAVLVVDAVRGLQTADRELLALLRCAAQTRGLIILTDSDGAGLVIRNFLRGALPKEGVLHAYVPEIAGKEKRKAAPGKAGLIE